MFSNLLAINSHSAFDPEQGSSPGLLIHEREGVGREGEREKEKEMPVSANAVPGFTSPVHVLHSITESPSLGAMERSWGVLWVLVVGKLADLNPSLSSGHPSLVGFGGMTETSTPFHAQHP